MSVIDPQRWARVNDILQDALEHEELEQGAFVLAACGEDEELRRDVQSLLAYQRSGANALEQPAAEALRLVSEHPTTLTGRRVGPYRVLREIGHGGMGTVYLGTRDDHQYRHDVAIKVVKRGMDSDLVLRRFHHERQILANLTHPNIARLLDGGTTDDGLPYFVMELVDGVPLDEYCQVHGLTILDRLKLFRIVCVAVEHAHRNLVVHRDLKPTNILVTADGVPKLLDFGIAKVVDAQGDPAATALTAIARPMTPEYASPEQAKGEAVTVATDVYSLGMLLYELLTDRRPYQFPSALSQDVTRVICEEQPVRPSIAVMQRAGEGEGRDSGGVPSGGMPGERRVTPYRLRRQLRGDLDNLVLMALRKEPERRYASVEQLSEDIGRFLERRPIRARADTPWYRAARLVQRHQAAVVATVLVAVTLLGGIVGTTRAARRAERRFNDVRALANSFVFEIHDSIKDLPGATPARALLVRRALQYLDGLAVEASTDVSLQLELAAAYQKIGDVQGNHNYSNLGDTASALASYRKAAAIGEAIVARMPRHTQARGDLSVSYIKIGDMLSQLGEARNALNTYQHALTIADDARRADRASLPAQRHFALSHHKVGNALMDLADLAGAREHHSVALEVRQRIAAEAPTDRRALRDVAISHERLAKVCRKSGDFGGALEHAGSALRESQSLADAQPLNGEARRDVGVGLQQVGLIQMEMGDLHGALAHFRDGLAIDEAMAAADPRNAGAQRDLASSHSTIGDVLGQLQQPAAALESYSRAIEVLEPLRAADPRNADLAAALATLWEQRGTVSGQLGSEVALSWQQRSGHWRSARSAYERSLEIVEDLKRGGITPPTDVPASETILAKIRTCDAALGALAYSSPDEERGRFHATGPRRTAAVLNVRTGANDPQSRP